ncbi:MAG: C39 family peptidase [[Clostridium] nexile]
MEGFTVQEGSRPLRHVFAKFWRWRARTSMAEEMNAGKSAIDILSEYSGGEGMDLTGCTTEEMLYIIGRGTPVIAMTDSSNAVLLIGYDTSTVTYIDPADGAVRTSTAEEIDSMVAGSGHTFIGYVKP